VLYLMSFLVDNSFSVLLIPYHIILIYLISFHQLAFSYLIINNFIFLHLIPIL